MTVRRPPSRIDDAADDGVDGRVAARALNAELDARLGLRRPRVPRPTSSTPPADAVDDDRPTGYSDDALALALAARHANALRYVAPTARWLWYADSRWRDDSTLSAFDAARALIREVGTRTLW